nr:MAG TPA: hypothetical protein [Caudoviricetes sp.]
MLMVALLILVLQRKRLTVLFNSILKNSKMY